jgi:hypothetical protein
MIDLSELKKISDDEVSDAAYHLWSEGWEYDARKILELWIEKERLREALTKLEEDLWNMTNAVDDGDWYGEVPIFGRVVAHKYEYHKLHVDRLEKMARFARAALKGDE